MTESFTQTDVNPASMKKPKMKEKIIQTDFKRRLVSKSTSTYSPDDTAVDTRVIVTPPSPAIMDLACPTDVPAETPQGISTPPKGIPIKKELPFEARDIEPRTATSSPPRIKEVPTSVAVIKGIPLSAPLQAIMKGLQGHDIKCLKLERLRSARTKKIKPIAVYLTEATLKIFELHNLCGYFIKVEPLWTPQLAPRFNYNYSMQPLPPPPGFARMQPLTFEQGLVNDLRRLLFLQPG